MNTQCSVCKHFHLSHECGAFPNGIPNEIVSGEIDHSDLHSNQDNDLVFEHYLIGINNDFFITC